MTDQYVSGAQRAIGEAGEEPGLSLAWMGLHKASMAAWMHFQSKMTNDPTPCYGRSEWTSGSTADKRTAIRLCGDCHAKAACNDFAIANNERGAIWAGISR